MNEQLDDRDRDLLAKRIERRAALPGPLVGDWLWYGERLVRFTYDWGEDGLQTTRRGENPYGGHFHLCR